MNSENLKLTKLLLVDDNPIDVELTIESFDEARIIVNMQVARNGIEALELLKSFKADIILLDLNMPKMDGREFLKKIKNYDEYKKIPVVILTTSQANKDIVMSYNLQASAYLSKPVRFDDFVKMMRQFKNFYLTYVKLPKEDE